MSFLFRPDQPRPGAPLGGKAGALLALHGRGFRIPDWFVVLPEAFAASGGLAEAGRWPDQPSAAVTRELHKALAEFCPGGELSAVRSSALDEDGLRHSFAGQLQSFLLVAPGEVASKVAAVWASAFSERVRNYRERHGLGAAHPPAVLIQRMVHAEMSGVAFSADPLNGRRDIVVVTAVRGLGSALVNGENDADTWRVDRGGVIVERPQTSPQRVLDDTQVRAVAELACRVEKILGPAQDIEWALSDGCLHLLQARPITALGEATYEPAPFGLRPSSGAFAPASRRAPKRQRAAALQDAGAKLQAELYVWDNSNIVESYSGVTSPLTFSFAQRAYEGVYRQFCQILAVPRAKIAAHAATFRGMLGLIRGRVYYNLLNWYRVLALLPGFTINRRFMEQMMGVKEELPAEILAELGHASLGARLKDALNLSISIAALVVNHFLLPLKIRRFRARLNDTLSSTPRPLAAMTAHELAAYFLTLERKLLTRWDAPLLNDFFAMIFYGVLRRLTTRWVGDAAGTLQNDLLCGEGGMISAEPAARLRTLATLARTDARFVSLLCGGAPAAILAEMEPVPGFACAYREYLDRFGERCLDELKLESLTLHDDPLMLLRAIGRLARAPAKETTDTGLSARQQAEARVHRALVHHPWRRFLFRWVLRHTRARVRDRENLRFERTRVFGRVRRIFVELGRRWQAQGHLRDARDVFYLEIDEALGSQGGGVRAAWPEVVRRRQQEFEGYRTTPKPPDRFTTRGWRAGWGVPAEPTGPRAGDSEAGQLGIGCCPGLVRGRVRKIADPRSAVLQPGEILVAERTDPGWILLFPAAAGLLLERGSLLSHSAIVARELRVPCIVSIDGLTAWLNDGDLVEMDGASGRVRRLATEADAHGHAVGQAPGLGSMHSTPSKTLDPQPEASAACVS